MSRLRFVTLDLTGTIYKFAKPPHLIYKDIAQREGIVLNEDKIKSSFLDSHQKTKIDYPNFGHGSLSSSKQWWSYVVASTFEKSSIKEEDSDKIKFIADELYEHYTKPEAYFIYPDAKDFLLNLRSLNLQVAAISNSDKRIHSVLESLELKEYFDFILSSEEVGHMKPDFRIFKKAMKHVSGGPLSDSSCLHIGDDLDKDYLALKKDPRWKSFLIKREGPFPPNVRKNEAFRSLSDIFLQIDY